METMDNALDTLSTARRLEHEYGMDARAAEGVAVAIHDHMTENLATKQDLHLLGSQLRGEMQSLRADMTTELQSLRADMTTELQSLRADMTTESQSLRSDMETLRAAMTTESQTRRADMASLRADMATEFKTLYRHLWVMFGGFAALIVTLTKLLP